MMLTRKSFLSSAGMLSGGLLLPAVSLAQSAGKPLLVKPVLENSYWYIGHLLSVLIKSADTNGQFALLQVTEIRGTEPPPHTHTREDETFLVLDGEMEFSVGGKTYHATAGSTMFLPRNVEHSFKVLSERTEVILLLTPGGFEQFFIEMSEPAPAMKAPPLPSGPPDIARIIATGAKYGIRMAAR